MTKFNNTSTDKHLAQMRREEAEELAQILSDKYGLPYVNLFTYPVNIDSLRVLEKEDVVKNKFAIFDILNKKLSVGVLSPKNEDSMSKIEMLRNKGYTVDIYMERCRLGTIRHSFGTGKTLPKLLFYQVFGRRG